jgi:hypothetical protein
MKTNYNSPINRTPFTENDRYVFTKGRAAKILGLKESDIEFIYLCPNTENGEGEILVGLFNRSVKIARIEFVKLYAEDRKARAKGLEVTPRYDSPSSYTVRNNGRNTTYKVTCYSAYVHCTCPDFETSTQIFKTNQVCCKHGYATLSYLKHGSLNEYIKSLKVKKDRTVS